MVIVLMGSDGSGAADLGLALAARLGWPFVDAHTPGIAAIGAAHGDQGHEAVLADARARVHRALDRREPLVLACLPLTAAERSHLAGERRPVRVVGLDGEAPGVALSLEGVDSADVRIERIRHEFGV